MRAYDRQSPLISIHIPKCAGTSFGNILRTWYGEKLKFNYFDKLGNRMPMKHSVAGEEGIGTCIHGHFNRARKFGIKDYYPEVGQFITMLRDPFQVFVSRFFYIRHISSINAVYKNSEVDDFHEYLENGRSSILLHMPHDMTLDNYKEIIEENFVYIGVVEDLQTSVDRLACKLGFQSTRLELLNTTDRGQEVPEHFREAFIERHPVEYAIYEYALANYKYW